MFRRLLAIAVILSSPLHATTYIVAPSGGDFMSIQAALDVAVAGDTILVKDMSGGYHEKLTFPRSGDAVLGPIVLQAYPNHHPAVDGSGVAGANMMSISSKSYIAIAGFEIRNNLNVHDGSGIRITGFGSHLEIRSNVI